MKYKKFKLNELFDTIKRGDYHVSGILDIGNIPLISCSTLDNGTEGYFDIPKDKRYINAVTIASDGKPLTSFYHQYEFAAKDNVVVCIPNDRLKLHTILYIIAKINAQSWRFSYGRKCYMNKLDKIEIQLPVKINNEIDQEKIDSLFQYELKNIMPKKEIMKEIKQYKITFKEFNITRLFELKRGDFHSIDALSIGDYPTVSRVTQNNGIVGYYEKPDNATVYPKFTITVSTVSGDAFVQLVDFIATDNVVMCIPKQNFRKTTLFFIAAMINKVKWRYSYGRQCYKRVFAKTNIYLPVDKNNIIDEKIIEKIVKNTPYWSYINIYIKNN